MLREARRTLTGRVIPFDRHPADIRVGLHADGMPAVTVDLRGPNGTRTFTDYKALLELALDLRAAAQYLLHS